MPSIPWGAILRHAPALVASAARLLVTADENRHKQNQTTQTRLDQLEKASVESAQLLRDLAEQVRVLAATQAAEARNTRIAIGLAAGAILIGVAAILLAVWR